MKKRFSEAQIIGFLREAEAGLPVKQLCRRHGFSEASYYLWRSKFGGMTVSDAKRLKELTAENTRLKKLLAESVLENEVGGVIRLSPARSKTLVGRILPISHPIAEALARRRARRDPDSPLVFHRDGIPIRRWRTAWRTACQAAGVPTRFLHDCRRTAARNLIRASVAERVAMLLTGHKTRAIFDRYNIINEQELLEAGDQLVAYLAQHAQATPRGGRPHPARTAAPRTTPLLRLVRRTTA